MITTSKTNEQAFEWLIERALVGSTKEEREAAGLTDVDAQQPDAQQYYWGLPKDLDKKWAVDMRRLWSFLETGSGRSSKPPRKRSWRNILALTSRRR